MRILLILLNIYLKFVNTIRTVSDTKRKFYQYHNKPINSIYRRIVEELMVEMHLLSVNVNFQPDPLYYLGVVTSFDRLMLGYKPFIDKDSIFQALCNSIEANASEYREKATSLLAFGKQKSLDSLIDWLMNPTSEDGINQDIVDSIRRIIEDKNFKYSRLLAIGLYSLLLENDPEVLKNQEKRREILVKLSTALHLPAEKMEKDLDLYSSNVEKMSQMLIVLEETLAASRKKQEEKKASVPIE